KASNKEWQSPTDPDSRIARMKDGTTHLAYKAEHTVDLDSEFVLAAAIHTADWSDPSTLVDSILLAQVNLAMAGSEQEVEEAVADKGYHKAEVLAECEQWSTRTYIPEPKGRDYSWQDKPREWRRRRKLIGGGPKGHAASGCRRSGASWWSGASPTCARRGAG